MLLTALPNDSHVPPACLVVLHMQKRQEPTINLLCGWPVSYCNALHVSGLCSPNLAATITAVVALATDIVPMVNKTA